jgi:Heterokaryon incompatibility protein (HET)
VFIAAFAILDDNMSRSQAANEYKYKLFVKERHEIRIIVIQPGELNDDILCDVKHLSLDAATYYEALSYTWGDCIRTVPISLGGLKFLVSPNLALALRHLRSKERHTPLWIDAICINQSDTAERNDQVQQMATIYQSAKKVHVWLGEPNEPSRLAMDFLKEVNAKVLESEQSEDSQRCLLEVERWIVEKYYDPEKKPTWDAIARLWQRAYWTRIWIIQEVVFGTSDKFQCTIHCGNDSIAWETLVALDHAMSFIDEALEDNEHSDADLFQESKAARLDLSWFLVIHGVHTRNKELPLSYLLIRQGRYKATDPRDKVYALMSMVHESQADGLVVDYGLPTAEVYTMAMKEIVLREQKLGVLCACCRECHMQVPLAELPSWCPDWSIDPMDKCCPARLWSYTKPIYSASDELNADAYFYFDQNKKPVLSAAGWLIDTIKVSDVKYTPNGFPTNESLLFLADGINNLHPQAPEHISSGAHEAIWRTLVANRGQFHDKPLDIFRQMYWNLFLQSNPTIVPPQVPCLIEIIRQDPAAAAAAGSLPEDAIAPFRDKMHICLRKRRLAKSETRFLPGIVPEMARGGDLIVVLVGCALPIILRRVLTDEEEAEGEVDEGEEGKRMGKGMGMRAGAGGKEHYVVIGESYVHGFMYGEVLGMEERGEVRRERFDIY